MRALRRNSKRRTARVSTACQRHGLRSGHSRPSAPDVWQSRIQGPPRLSSARMQHIRLGCLESAQASHVRVWVTGDPGLRGSPPIPAQRCARRRCERLIAGGTTDKRRRESRSRTALSAQSLAAYSATRPFSAFSTQPLCSPQHALLTIPRAPPRTEHAAQGGP